YPRQPHLPRRRPQLQPADVHGGEGGDHPGAPDRARRRHRSGGGRDAGHLRPEGGGSAESGAGGGPQPRPSRLPRSRLTMADKLSNDQIAWRAAQDIRDGAYVNLGIGFPEKVAKYQPPGRQAIFHTENGILNFGESPAPGEEDWDLINAGKKAVTLKPGAAFFHHADSFAMVR